MKKTSPYLLSLLLTVTSCTTGGSDTLVEPGVSHELAQLRYRTIHDLRYDLSFDIPEQQETAIEARAAILFSLDSLWSVQLDFREEPSKLHQLTVNGAEVTIDWQSEHIILPQSALQVGDNRVEVSFTAGEQSLNRRADYLYTLFVPDRARTVFPCFDQPNLKARFTLALDVPQGWVAVSNSPIAEAEGAHISYRETEPLSTYLFAFAAGRFDYQTYTDPQSGRTIGAYYRETDPQRLAQLPDIMGEVCFALDWQEQFTAQPYPFAKYDLVILPGFQFGGMEHTGATFYNDNTLFLSARPTLQERLSRSNLIAHETSHMWFGDLVTMQWFDDVWTKEVFANYFAAAITEPLYPTIDHDLNWLSTFQSAALSEDRTLGGTAIQQPLDNLRNAGLIYNQIIYNKAPVVMRKMVELMGPEAFRRGIRRYIHDFAYANATWDDLVTRLDAETDVDLQAFSRVWVKEKGLPHIELSLAHADPSQPASSPAITRTERDPYHRGLSWPQSWADSLTATGQILPNADGRGYAIYTFADTAQLQGLTHQWQLLEGAGRQSLLMTLADNYLLGHLTATRWKRTLVDGLAAERNPLIAGTLVSYLSEPMLCEPDAAIEAELLQMARQHPLPAVRTQLWRLLAQRMTAPQTLQAVEAEWQRADNPLLSINDYMTMSYELAVRQPAQAERIIATQRQRIDNADRLRQYDFVSRSVVASAPARDSLFQQLITDPQARRIEPWTRSVLYYLNHPVRQAEALHYIRPALEALPEVQRTGDIFFPGQWCSNLLDGHRSEAAAAEVDHFLRSHPDLNPLLRNKILVAASRVL